MHLDLRYVPNVTEQIFRIVSGEKAQFTKNLAIKKKKKTQKKKKNQKPLENIYFSYKGMQYFLIYSLQFLLML